MSGLRYFLIVCVTRWVRLTMKDPPLSSESEIKLSKMLATGCLAVKMTNGSEYGLTIVGKIFLAIIALYVDVTFPDQAHPLQV